MPAIQRAFAIIAAGSIDLFASTAVAAPESLREVPIACTVVTSEEISKASSPSVADTLKSVPASNNADRSQSGCQPLTPFDRYMLDTHNAERAAVEAPPLRWNRQLAEHAAEYAKQLAAAGRLIHSPREGRGTERENLQQGLVGWSPAQMIRSWLKEKANFIPGTFPNVARDGNWLNVAHYTQMIWKATTDLGCAVAQGSGFSWMVCRYSPGGNKDGKPVGPVTTNEIARTETPSDITKEALDPGITYPFGPATLEGVDPDGPTSQTQEEHFIPHPDAGRLPSFESDGLGSSESDYLPNNEAVSKLLEEWAIQGAGSTSSVHYSGSSRSTDDWWDSIFGSPFSFNKPVSGGDPYVHRIYGAEIRPSFDDAGIYTIARNFRYDSPPSSSPPVNKVMSAGRWIDSKTGQPVPTVIIMPGKGEISFGESENYHLVIPDAGTDRAYDPVTGRNFARGEGGGWIDAKTGEPVPTAIVMPGKGEINFGTSERSHLVVPGADDPNRAYDPVTGRNFSKAPMWETRRR